MKVVSYDTWVVRVPYEAHRAATHIVLRLNTDDGAQGIAYLTPFLPWTLKPIHAAVDSLMERVRGADPMAVESLNAALLARTSRPQFDGLARSAISIIDIALWDLKAKAIPQRSRPSPCDAGIASEGLHMKKHFEDLDTGTVFWGDECAVDKEEMIQYALKNDPLPFHVDEQAAANSPYGGLIASGGYTVSLWYRSGIRLFAEMAFLGGFEWHIKLLRPVRANDRLRIKITIAGKRLSSKPGRGYVTNTQEMFNQDGDVVFSCETVWMLATRQAPTGGGPDVGTG